MDHTPRPKRKILFVSSNSESLETSSSLYTILDNLDRNAYEAIVTVHKEGPLMEMVQNMGWKVVKLHRIRLAKDNQPPLQGLGERLTWWLWKKTRGEKVVQLIREEQIDLIHTNSMICFEGAYAAHVTGRPHIWHIREILPGNRKLFGVFGTLKTLKMISRFSDKVVCISDAVKRQFPGWQRNPEKYLTLYNGVDVNVFDPDTVTMSQASLHTQLNLPEDTPILTSVIRYRPDKGFMDMVEACQTLANEGIPFHLVLVGQPVKQRYLHHYQSLLNEAGLTRQCHFMGQVPPTLMPELLKQTAVFLAPTTDEPFGISILQAMAMAVPVVGFQTGGLPEAVLHKKTGLLVKNLNSKDLADALKTLLKDPQLARQLGSAARERVQTHFRLDQFMARLHQLYLNALTDSSNH